MVEVLSIYRRYNSAFSESGHCSSVFTREKTSQLSIIEWNATQESENTVLERVLTGKSTVR